MASIYKKNFPKTTRYNVSKLLVLIQTLKIRRSDKAVR